MFNILRRAGCHFISNVFVYLLLTFVIVLMFQMAIVGHCQTSRSITGGPYVAAGSNVGLTSAIAGGHATITLPAISHFTFTADGFFLPRYPKHGDGSAYGFESRARVYVRRAFGMVGVQRTTAQFNSSGRTSTHALLGGGYSTGQAVMEAYYATPDHTRYRLQKFGGRLDFFQPLGASKWIVVIRPGVEFFWYGFEGGTLRGVKPGVSVQVGRAF